MSLRIAHFVYFGPKMAGIYETAREMCQAECELGHDAKLVDTSWIQNKKEAPVTSKFDRGVEVVPTAWSLHADIHVLHSMIPAEVYGKKPVVIILHGAPEYVFYGELMNSHAGDRSFSTLLVYAQDRVKVKKAVTLWPRHLDYWKPIFGEDRTVYVPSCVDVREYKPEGSKLEFLKSGKPNIGFVDSWRTSFGKTPYQVVHAMVLFYKKYPEAKLQLFSVPPADKRDIVWDRFINTLRINKHDVFGDLRERHNDMPGAYRALDMIVTPTGDASRAIRESLASGTPVVAPLDCAYTDYTADFDNPADLAAVMETAWKEIQADKSLVQKTCIETAKKEFNMETMAKQLVGVFEEVVKENANAGSSQH